MRHQRLGHLLGSLRKQAGEFFRRHLAGRLIQHLGVNVQALIRRNIRNKLRDRLRAALLRLGFGHDIECTLQRVRAVLRFLLRLRPAGCSISHRHDALHGADLRDRADQCCDERLVGGFGSRLEKLLQRAVLIHHQPVAHILQQRGDLFRRAFPADLLGEHLHHASTAAQHLEEPDGRDHLGAGLYERLGGAMDACRQVALAFACGLAVGLRASDRTKCIGNCSTRRLRARLRHAKWHQRHVLAE